MPVNEALRRSGLLHESELARFCRDGHFVYESGGHGDLWLTLDRLFVSPRRLQRAVERLAAKLRPYAPDLVCGPLLGGALVGQWLAHELGVAFVFAEPKGGPEGGYAVPPALRPLVRSRRAIIVDDAINAGAATLPTIRDLEAAGGSVAAVAALLVRAPGCRRCAPAWASRSNTLSDCNGIPGGPATVRCAAPASRWRALREAAERTKSRPEVPR